MSVDSLNALPPSASPSGQCMMSEEFRDAGAWIFFVMDSIVGFAFPATLIVVCNVITIVAIQRQKRRAIRSPGHQQSNAEERRSYDQVGQNQHCQFMERQFKQHSPLNHY